LIKQGPKLLIAAIVSVVWVCPAVAGKKPKTVPSENVPVHRCTDLEGEAVPCPAGNAHVELPSATNGSADLDDCVDASGEPVSCSEKMAEAEHASQSSKKAQENNGRAGAAKIKPVARTAGGATSSPEPTASESLDTVCRDLLGEPASCPLNNGTAGAASETVGSTSAPNKDSNEVSAATSSAIYDGPSTKTPKSLERSLPRDIYLGQKDFWTMPLHFGLDDAYWGVPFAITTGGLIASDVSIKNALPQNPNTIKRFDNISNYGAIAFGGLVGGSYVLGKLNHNSYMADTAWLAGEAGLNGFITSYALKSILGRQRPTEGNGQGDFFSGGQSFPSEHAMAAWSVATVYSARYPGTLTKLAMFGGASLITTSRVIGQKHFASDAFVGSALGYYFGRQALQRYQREHATDAMYGTFERSSDARLAEPSYMGSEYVPLDSWIYPVMDRLVAFGVIRTAPLAQRPWARLECARLVREGVRSSSADSNNQVQQLLSTLQQEFAWEDKRLGGDENVGLQAESLYARVTDIAGQPINDSFHFGQTLYNDYGRPYQEGFNAVTGFSGRAMAGPLVFYLRGEYQHSPFAPPYSESVRAAIAVADDNPVQPATPFNTVNRFRVVEGYVGFNFANNQISIGKQSLWWGPARGGSLLESNNATPVLMIRYTRVTPLKLPSLLKYLGPVYYDSYFGKLDGHQFPPNPWTYGQKVSFKPTPFFEFGVSRTTVFAGEGITPLTWGNFVHSYFSYSSTDKGTSTDPGDRRGGFNFSYQIPGLRNWLTVYAEGIVDDDPSPLAAPRRAAWNPGIYLSHLPGLPKMDLRAEAVYTDLPNERRIGGKFFYWEFIYHDSYTNNGNIMGGWVGREGIGYQASTTYWFSPRQTLQFAYRNGQVAPDFMPGGVTFHDGSVKADFLIRKQWSISSTFQYEHLNAPLLNINQQSNITTSFQVTFWPKWSLSK
jgi:membrane-associated phospholipid phosphatase